MFTASAAPVMIGGDAIAAAASAPPVLIRNSLRFCLGEVRRTDRFISIPPWDVRRPLIPAASILISRSCDLGRISAQSLGACRLLYTLSLLRCSRFPGKRDRKDWVDTTGFSEMGVKKQPL